MKNKDNHCLWWCLASWRNSAEANSERITKELRKHFNALDRSGIESPVAVDANVYAKIEKNNNININVFGYEKETGIYPLYTSNSMYDRAVDLLLISDQKMK